MSGALVRRGRKWSVVLYAGTNPKTGARRQRWVGGFDSRRDAEAFRVHAATHPAFGAGVGAYGSPRLRTGDFLDDWLARHRDNLKPRSAERLEDFIRLYLKPGLGHVALSKLSPQAIDELYRDMIHEKGLSSTTVKHAHACLHKALEDAVSPAWGLIVQNPSESVTVPKDGRPKFEATIWTPAQVEKFLEASEQHATHHLLYLTLIGTGARAGEVLGLRWEDLDLERGVARICRTLERPGRKPKYGTPKTEKSRRPITLPPILVDALRSVQRKTGLVFCQKNGRPLHLNNLRRWDFYPTIKKARIPRIRIHDLRHAHASFLLQAGVPMAQVSERLGHSSQAFTYSVYSHLIPGQDDAVKAANDLLITSKGSVH
jgi:integrase